MNKILIKIGQDRYYYTGKGRVAMKLLHKLYDMTQGAGKYLIKCPRKQLNMSDEQWKDIYVEGTKWMNRFTKNTILSMARRVKKKSLPIQKV